RRPEHLRGDGGHESDRQGGGHFQERDSPLDPAGDNCRIDDRSASVCLAVYADGAVTTASVEALSWRASRRKPDVGVARSARICVVNGERRGVSPTWASPSENAGNRQRRASRRKPDVGVTQRERGQSSTASVEA